MEGLTIKKGGIVERTRWDSKLKKPAYVTTDVTDRAHQFLFEQVTLAEDVTLRDIFLILQRRLEFYDELLGNWCKEIVTEAFSISEDQQQSFTQGGMQYLEVYWMLTESQDEDKVSLSGHHFPAFHGWGTWEDGTEGGYGVEFTPVYQLLDYPVRLNQEMPIYDDIGRIPKPPRVYQDATYTLGHVLYGIIWELSFFGSPTMRDGQREEIFETISEMKSQA
jgi:hypothetical protein